MSYGNYYRRNLRCRLVFKETKYGFLSSFDTLTVRLNIFSMMFLTFSVQLSSLTNSKHSQSGIYRDYRRDLFYTWSWQPFVRWTSKSGIWKTAIKKQMVYAEDMLLMCKVCLTYKRQINMNICYLKLVHFSHPFPQRDRPTPTYNSFFLFL